MYIFSFVIVNILGTQLSNKLEKNHLKTSRVQPSPGIPSTLIVNVLVPGNHVP